MVQLAVGSRLKVSPYYAATLQAGLTHVSIYNRMLMPTSYGDPMAEYWRLIKDCAIWDVAVERQVEITGPDAFDLVQYLCARDLKNCVIGKGKYVPLCDHDGVLINDPVLLRLAEDRFWLSIADSDILLWAKAVAGERRFEAHVSEADVAPLAVQGPKAEDVIAALFGDWVRELKLFWFKQTELDGIPLVLARSGWSKQGGFELYLTDASRGQELWDRVWAAGEAFNIGPGGPNAIERVESGLLSYGADTDDHTNAFEAGMGRFVSIDAPGGFIGKAALRAIAAAGPRRQQVGFFVDGEPLAPSDRKWALAIGGETVGFASSVVHSPRLDRNIGIGLIESRYAVMGTPVAIYAPDGLLNATVTGLPFI